MIKMVLTIGTDCSGIEAPIQALRQLKIPFRHVWACEIDKFARQSIEANYSPETMYEDMTKPRDLPQIDLYVCGFSCQPFSSAGNHKGTDDPRGNLFFNAVDAIKKSKPKVFILENVKGIMSGEFFETIKDTLANLDYVVDYHLLNTKDYGIPQNRERLYIIGSKNGIPKPEHLPCKPVEDYIDYEDKSKNVYSNYDLKKKHVWENSNFITIDAWRIHNSPAKSKYAHTITTKPVWCIPMHRKANMKELLSLQGFPTDFKQVVSKTQLRKQIGNSMSVNVLVEIFKKIYLVSRGSIREPKAEYALYTVIYENIH